MINTGATVDHDNVIEDGVHVSPGCHLAGNVTCRRDAFLGTGAAVIPQVTIGERAIIAAGAVVHHRRPRRSPGRRLPGGSQETAHDLRGLEERNGLRARPVPRTRGRESRSPP